MYKPVVHSLLSIELHSTGWYPTCKRHAPEAVETSPSNMQVRFVSHIYCFHDFRKLWGRMHDVTICHNFMPS